MPVVTEWHGKEVQMRMRRAAGRALVAIGMTVVANGKVIVRDPAVHPIAHPPHKWTGTLSRSIHLAPIFYPGDADEQLAAAGDVDNAGVHDVLQTPEGSFLEVGSWLVYSNIEEEVRGHHYMTPAMDLARTVADDIVFAAVKSEGL